MVAFAGDPVYAAAAIRAASGLEKGSGVLDFLVAEHVRCSRCVDYLYAYVDQGVPKLFRISGGVASQLTNAYIGKPESFRRFQEIRNALELDPMPSTIYTLLGGVSINPNLRGTSEAAYANPLQRAILAMQALFYETSDREVGGTVLPFVLDEGGAKLYSYGYSVTDKIADKLGFGALIPTGTAPGGGYGLSVTELKERDGFVFYWLQRPGGEIWVRNDDWYESLKFDGSPATFKAKVKESIGRDIDLWFGEVRKSQPDIVRMIPDKSGIPALAVAQSGRALSFSSIAGNASFAAFAKFSLSDGLSDEEDEGRSLSSLKLATDDKKSRLVIKFDDVSLEGGELSLDAEQVDELISCLSKIRAEIAPPISSEIIQGTALDAIYDPRWETTAIHESNRLLVFRHPGLGWVSFVMPQEEAAHLGACLQAGT